MEEISWATTTALILIVGCWTWFLEAPSEATIIKNDQRPDRSSIFTFRIYILGFFTTLFWIFSEDTLIAFVFYVFITWGIYAPIHRYRINKLCNQPSYFLDSSNPYEFMWINAGNEEHEIAGNIAYSAEFCILMLGLIGANWSILFP